jgi:signal peptidase I
MKKRYIVLLTLAGSLPVIWTFARLTNALQWYTIPTTSNYPSLKLGDHVFGSNLVKPNRFDFITYRAEIPNMGVQTMTHRLCGVEGDMIQIKGGDLYINNKLFDKTLTLAHYYTMEQRDYKRLDSLEQLNEQNIVVIGKDSFMTNVSDRSIQLLTIKASRKVLLPTETDELIQNRYHKRWNSDNFGPLKVPKGKYFVLGDNRNSAQDSRYLGFIDKSNYLTTLLNH